MKTEICFVFVFSISSKGLITLLYQFDASSVAISDSFIKHENKDACLLNIA